VTCLRSRPLLVLSRPIVTVIGVLCYPAAWPYGSACSVDLDWSRCCKRTRIIALQAIGQPSPSEDAGTSPAGPCLSAVFLPHPHTSTSRLGCSAPKSNYSIQHGCLPRMYWCPGSNLGNRDAGPEMLHRQIGSVVTPPLTVVSRAITFRCGPQSGPWHGIAITGDGVYFREHPCPRSHAGASPPSALYVVGAIGGSWRQSVLT